MNSSSPKMSATGDAGLTTGEGISLFGLGAGLVDLVQHLAHVLDLIEEDAAHKDWFLLRRGDGEAIARPGVNFHKFPRDFIVLLQDEPGEIGGVLQFGDDDALDVDAEALKNPVDEVVR